MVAQFVLTYMKNLAILIALLICQVSWTQNIYGSVSGGYQRIIQSTQPPSYIVNTYHQISYPWFTRLEGLSFSDAVSTVLSFGHLLTENIGYELTGSYLKPLTVIEENGYTEHQFSGRFFRTSFKIVLSIPIQKFDLYSKLGVNYTIGKLYYYQRLYNKGEMPLSFEESTLKYEYTNGSRLGYNLALGTSFNFNERLSVFTEIYAIYQPFEPSKGQRIEQTTDGISEMQYADEPYFSQIQFGAESMSYYYSEDKSQPQKLYKRNYSLGGVGINLGVKFILFEKKKEVSSAP
ncbi:MAG: hypothetical protein COA32_17500 [Fluviicola sp.]|nr:MAG: hypothetical protein COA32_17500 [Fluviicola sp.]